MKREIFQVCAPLAILLASCGSITAMFPFDTAPSSPHASMLVLEIGKGKPGVSDNLSNLNYSGWAPIVK